MSDDSLKTCPSRNFTTLRKECGLLLDRLRHLIANHKALNPRENEYDAGFEEGYLEAIRYVEGALREVISGSLTYCDTEPPVPDFDARNELANLASRITDLESRCSNLGYANENLRKEMDALSKIAKEHLLALLLNANARSETK